jgi:peptide/nickel transport system permease protein
VKIRPAAAGALLLVLLIATAIVTCSKAGVADQDRDALLEGRTAHHLAGTDALGRDRLVRVSAALLLGLAGAIAASALSTAAAAAVGVLAVFSSSFLANVAMLLCDVFLALPLLFLLMMVRSMLSLTTSPAHSAAITFLLLAAVGWPACARAVYKGALALRNSDWLLYARAGGMRTLQVPAQVLPNLLQLLLPQFLLCVPAFVVAEANLGVLGLGVSEPLPSWGGMLLELGNSATLVRTSWVYLPIAVLVTVLLLLESMTKEIS